MNYAGDARETRPHLGYAIKATAIGASRSWSTAMEKVEALQARRKLGWGSCSCIQKTDGNGKMMSDGRTDEIFVASSSKLDPLPRLPPVDRYPLGSEAHRYWI
jgi:hypothetical protein